MERLGSQVLTDPEYRVPAVEPGETGLVWLRGHVVRFSDGDCHMRRRVLTEEIVHEVMRATFVVSPTVPTTRRVREDVTLVEVDLADAHFGPGSHRCPADELARRRAEEALS